MKTDSLIAIQIDRREQTPLTFSDQVIVVHKSMPTGDYCPVGFSDYFAIERKSLADLLNSLSNDRERFEREMERGKLLDYWGLVIEAAEEDPKRVYEAGGCDAMGRKRYAMVHYNSVYATLHDWEVDNKLHVHWRPVGANWKVKELCRFCIKDLGPKYPEAMAAQQEAIKLAPTAEPPERDSTAAAGIVPGAKFAHGAAMMDGKKK